MNGLVCTAHLEVNTSLFIREILMLGGVEFISACAWLSPRFVIQPGALAEQEILFFLMKNAKK